MTYTYDLANSDAELVRISQIRFEIGDQREASGVLEDGTNLSDDEVRHFLSQEGDDVMRATAHALEILANHYAGLADIMVGPRQERYSQITRAYERRAKIYRDRYGGERAEVFSVGVIRVDGYSDDEPSDAVDTTGSEFEGGFEYIRP